MQHYRDSKSRVEPLDLTDGELKLSTSPIGQSPHIFRLRLARLRCATWPKQDLGGSSKCIERSGMEDCPVIQFIFVFVFIEDGKEADD